jgi:hypothetical protein
MLADAMSEAEWRLAETVTRLVPRCREDGEGVEERIHVCHLAGTSRGPCLALPEPERTQSLATSLTRPRSAHQCNHGREPPSQHCGAGLGPDRDITGSWRDVDEPCASLPTVPPNRARARRGNCRFFYTGKRNPARDGLFAGGNRIRTIGSAGEGPDASCVGSLSL